MKKHYPKIYDCCEKYWDMKEVMFYVFVDKNVIYASNSHVLIKHKTDEIFSSTDDFIDSIPDTGILIHWKHFKEMTRYGCDNHQIENNLIKYKYDNLWCYIPFKINGDELKYPNAESVFPKDMKAVDKIGIDSRLLKMATEAMDFENRPVKITFYGVQKALLLTHSVSNYPSAKCIVMPALFGD